MEIVIIGGSGLIGSMSGGVRLTALNRFVSESVDVVLHCTRTADRQAPRPRSQRSRTYWARRRHPIFAVIEVFRPPDQSLAGDRSPADAGRLDLGQRGAGRPPPSHLHERFTRSGHESNHCRRQALAKVTETWRSSRTSARARGPRRSEPAVPGAGERGEPCVVLVDSRERAYVSLQAGAAAIFPP
jgi:hypothetical protein